MKKEQHCKAVSTELFAEANLVKAQSVRSRYCRTGSYFGAIPTKLPNGKLVWQLPSVKVNKISGCKDSGDGV